MSKYKTTVDVPQTVDAIQCDAPECSRYETNANNALRRFFHHWINISAFGIEILRDDLDFCSFQCLENWLVANRARLEVVEAEVRAANN